MSEMQEVKSLREVPRVPEHCGEPMRRMQNASPSTGTMLTVYVCGCGHQTRLPEPKGSGNGS